MSNIYLDYSADTPPDERVLSVYTEAAGNVFANPNSLHSEGKKAKSLVDASLESI